MKLWALALLPFVFASTLEAAPVRKKRKPAPPADVVEGGVALTQDGKPLAWSTDLQWGKFQTPKGRSLVGPIVLINAPPANEINLGEATLENGALISGDKTKVKLRMGSMADKITLPQGATPIEIKLKLTASKIDWESCERQQIKIEALGAPAKTPYYLMFSCLRRSNRIVMGLSHPSELDAFSSSAVEREGKGESYKVYELTSSANLGIEGELMRFEFRVGDETQKFRVVDAQRAGKADDQKEPVFVYRASIGAGSYGFTAPDRSSSSVQPVISAEFRTAPFWGRFAGSGGLFLSPGIALSGEPSNSLSFEVGLGYRIGGAPKGNSFYAEPSARFYAIHQTLQKQGISAHHNQAGLGLVLGNKGALDTSGFEISAAYSGLSGDSNHYEGGFRYAFPIASVASGIGLSYASQDQKNSAGTYNFQRALLHFYFWP